MSSSSSSHTKRLSKRRSTDAANRQRQQLRSPVVHLRPMISDLSAQVKSKVIGQVTKVEATMVGTFRATAWKDDSGQKTMIRRTGNDQQDSLRDQLKSLLGVSLNNHDRPQIIFIELGADDSPEEIDQIVADTDQDLRTIGILGDSDPSLSDLVSFVYAVSTDSLVSAASSTSASTQSDSGPQLSGRSRRATRQSASKESDAQKPRAAPRKRPEAPHIDANQVVRNFLNASDSPLPDIVSSELTQLVDFLKQDDNSNQLIDVYSKMIENMELHGNADGINDDQKAFYFGVEAAYFSNIGKRTQINRNISKLTSLKGKDTSKSGDNIWQGTFEEGDGRVWVIKRLLEENPKIRAVGALGINPGFPRILDRSMVYSQIGRISDAFKKLVPETTFGYADLADGNKSQLVQMIEKVGGENPTTARQWLANRQKSGPKLTEVERGVFARDLTRMQYLDYLMSQVDRQIGNYMVEVDANGTVTGLKTIDNDFSLTSKKLKLHVDLVPGNLLLITGTLDLPLPPLADLETINFFHSISDDVIKQMADGRLTPTQFELMSARLKEIKSHLENLASDDANIVKNDDAWKSRFLELKLAANKLDVNTYVDVIVASDAKNLFG